MSIIEQQKYKNIQAASLIQGEKARIKSTGQVVELKRVSEHGVSVVSFRGADYFISNIFLEPVIDFQ
jgi:hypothetical protein